MSRPVTFGFYAHHHGRGHLARAAEIVRELGAEACSVGTSRADAVEVLPAGTDVRTLPMDVPPAGEARGDVTAGGALHWAPTHPVALERSRALLDWLAERRPAVVLVDVSVEVALTVRLAGIPVVVSRIHGDRRDAPHDLAHRIAETVLAPYPAALEHPSTPAHVLERTVHTGFVTPPRTVLDVERDPRRVVVSWGQGSPPPPAAVLDRAAAATPDHEWHLIGPAPEGELRLVRHHGWVPDPISHLAGAGVVVGPPGGGLVADVIAAGSRLVAVCEPRPFDEQRHKGEVLDAVGAAVAVDGWPAPAAWPELLGRAASLEPGALGALGAGGAAAAADVLRAVAARTGP